MILAFDIDFLNHGSWWEQKPEIKHLKPWTSNSKLHSVGLGAARTCADVLLCEHPCASHCELMQGVIILHRCCWPKRLWLSTRQHEPQCSIFPYMT